MNNMNFRGLLSAVCIASILACFTRIDAGPVRFEQVVQVVDATPGRASTGSFTRLRMADDFAYLGATDDEDDKRIKAPLPQDGRVITETRTEIVTDDVCDCEEEVVVKRGFPKWALLGLAAIPIAFILIRRNRSTPTPTRTVPDTTPTPGITPTPTPDITPTPTPDITPTPTPGMTPTPTPGMTPTPTTTPTPGVTPTPTPVKSPTPTPEKTPSPTPSPGVTPSPTPKKTPSPTPPHITPTPPPPEPIPEPMTILLFGTGLASIGLAARRKFGKKGESAEEKGGE